MSAPRCRHCHNGLTSGRNIDMCHSHFLLALAAMFVQRLQLLCIERHQLLGMLSRHIPPRKCLFTVARPPKAFKRRKMRSNHLCCQHPFGAIRRLKALI